MLSASTRDALAVVGVTERAVGLAAPAPAALPPAVDRRAPRPSRSRLETIALWSCRALILTPFVFMGPELVALIFGQRGAVANVAESTADVFGTSSFLLFMFMLTITPLATITGWTWHLPLRRDFGVGMFVVGLTDLVLAAITTGATFKGGVLARIGGRSFLVVGTLSVLLLVPLALTANKRAHRWLGAYWKRLHRLVYVVWALILVHLVLLFGVTGIFLQALGMSVPLFVLRLPAVRRWWTSKRRAHRQRVLRGALAIVMIATFVVAARPVIAELVLKGKAAFVEKPID